MDQVTAVISMLHEPVAQNSASRLFRREPVLSWTMQRLRMSRLLESIALICWEDQLQQVTPLASDHEVYILAKGPRVALPTIDTVSAARRWTDGWRGGLMNTCDFDIGFHGPWLREVMEKLSSAAVVLIDPSAGLVDPRIIDQLIEHSGRREQIELCFTQAAPGLGGALLRRSLVDRLAAAGTHPGRILHYLPDQPMRDPIGGEGCVPVPKAVARTTRSFRLDSDRQIARLTAAAVDLNGELVQSDAEDLVNRLNWTPEVDLLPREVILEITARRATSPMFNAAGHLRIDRPDMPLELARRIFDQLGRADDIRITLGGVGDPLLHPRLSEMLQDARQAGLRALHVETDLLPEDQNAIEQLAESEVDIVSVHLPAMNAANYARIMRVDAFTTVIENMKRFLTRRHELRRGVPILVPVFTKCRLNLSEMEAWYDQWLKALGSAVIAGPTDLAGLIPDSGVADMAPPNRRPCSRIWSGLSILCDGTVVSCEQDVLGRQLMGDARTESVSTIWKHGFSGLRSDHSAGCFASRPACVACREWHRP